jgi:hypothetical protein
MGGMTMPKVHLYQMKSAKIYPLSGSPSAMEHQFLISKRRVDDQLL